MLLPIVRTEVYPGALDGDDRNPDDPGSIEVWPRPDGRLGYPNAMGAQAGHVYAPGPAALADSNPDTFVRVSSAWAADWWVVLDGTALGGMPAVPIEVDVRSRYCDPTDSRQYHDVQLTLQDWTGTGTDAQAGYFASAEVTHRIPAGGTATVTWLLDQAWLNGTHANDGNSSDYDNGWHWNANDAGHGYATFVADLLTHPDNAVCLYVRVADGGHPYELDVMGVRIGTTDAPVIATTRPTRLYPRDDGLGLSSASRVHPPSKTRRLVGGYS